VRDRVGIIDLSSFGKIDVTGPGALSLLQRAAANDLDVPDGSVVYTPWCDQRGGMVADVTVTRLGSDHLRVVTGAGFVAGDLAWLRHQRAHDEVVTIRDVSGEYATIGLWGPRARDVLAAVTTDAVDDAALPLRRAVSVPIGAEAIPTLAARISYAGELGWELTVPAERAVGVWDALRAAGADHGFEPFGYRALDALRMEKGYRYYSTDMTMLETPYEAGLGRFVRLQKGEFIGRDALRQARDDATGVGGGPARRLTSVYVGEDGAWRPVYGGEAVRAGGEVIGRLRSVAYGPCVERTIATVYLGADDPAAGTLTVDVFDDRVPAVVAPDVPWDPTGERMRG
jgi:4-methylaminobutanoate oxidase (formaldehyde-forming)